MYFYEDTDFFEFETEQLKRKLAKFKAINIPAISTVFGWRLEHCCQSFHSNKLVRKSYP